MSFGRTDAVVGGLGNRWRLYGLALGEGARRLRRHALRAGRALLPFGFQQPERLLIAPQDLRTSDPTVAGDIYAGYFAFGGRVVSSKGRSPFQAEPPSRAWAEALNGFVWLRHLRAADSALARANARALVDDFLAQGADRKGIAAEPRIVARRLISFLSQSPLVLDGADHGFYKRFLRALGRGVAQLQRALAGGARGEERLAAAIALAYAGLCLDGFGRTLKLATRVLAEELARQILPDGGHIGRNPRLVVDLLTDLLPLRQAYAARGVEPPAALLGAIDRMMPMLRLFRHGDGSLALFNGMGVTAPDLVATLLIYDDVRARALEHAPHSGYERLQAGDTLVIADVGPPPPSVFSSEAHAGCLSFELSAGTSRIVVNCGAPRAGSAASTLAARSTAAHSTVTIADSSSCHFAGAGDAVSFDAKLGRFIGAPILSGPRKVDTAREAAEGVETLRGRHDGYEPRFGILHERSWRLEPGGERLDGEDGFVVVGTVPPGIAACVRFHLHPSVKASRLQNGHSVMLLLPDGEAWSFESDDVAPTLEESVFFAAPDGTRHTEQIVLTVDPATTHTVRWRFRRLGRHDTRPGRNRDETADDHLLF
ncbi:heparinase II/III family protein [Chelatococcus sp. SYSU_G07232]|uniref:Heparinase II/III family protein n=1 Tax=Chelatococcus albus TaxID=3047466 RepID=A0ABT7AK73_9HYPH|nr:heparinase II/III family protein [Chelatococcus sp. SYSU_G07232]MDJ1159771.1 heparinase II/III family protein [Chelatococcus sp. SYSU_G07232]